jgi:single-stranded DNA-binding protein
MRMRELLVQGFLGKDAEVSTTTGGKPVARFSVAYTDGDKGEEVTTWYRVTAFGNDRTDGGYLFKAASGLKKGDLVMIRGLYRTRLYKTEIQHEVTAGIVVLLPKPVKHSADDLPF